MAIHFDIYAVGICYTSVCTNLTDVAEIERIINEESLSGAEGHPRIQEDLKKNPWKVSKEKFKTGEDNPHPCENGFGRNHYLLERP